MKTGYSIKEATKKEWRKFLVMKRIRKYMFEMSFFDRLKFVLFGKFDL